MSVFDFRFTVNAPLAAVSAFHFEPGILKTLTPPLMIMQVHRFDPLANGSIGEFTMWMGPVPVRWKAEHSNVSERSFTDTQVAGPMKSWVHTHTFSAIDDNTTEVHEHIEFEHFGGLKGLWSRLLFPKPALFALFNIRKMITRREVARRLESADSLRARSICFTQVKKHNSGRVADWREVPCELQFAAVEIHIKHGNVVGTLIAAVQKSTGRIEVETARVIAACWFIGDEREFPVRSDRKDRDAVV